jgi:hypothetical protein
MIVVLPLNNIGKCIGYMPSPPIVLKTRPVIVKRIPSPYHTGFKSALKLYNDWITPPDTRFKVIYYIGVGDDD